MSHSRGDILVRDQRQSAPIDAERTEAEPCSILGLANERQTIGRAWVTGGLRLGHGAQWSERLSELAFWPHHLLIPPVSDSTRSCPSACSAERLPRVPLGP